LTERFHNCVRDRRCARSERRQISSLRKDLGPGSFLQESCRHVDYGLEQ